MRHHVALPFIELLLFRNLCAEKDHPGQACGIQIQKAMYLNGNSRASLYFAARFLLLYIEPSSATVIRYIQQNADVDH